MLLQAMGAESPVTAETDAAYLVGHRPALCAHPVFFFQVFAVAPQAETIRNQHIEIERFMATHTAPDALFFPVLPGFAGPWGSLVKLEVRRAEYERGRFALDEEVAGGLGRCCCGSLVVRQCLVMWKTTLAYPLRTARTVGEFAVRRVAIRAILRGEGLFLAFGRLLLRCFPECVRRSLLQSIEDAVTIRRSIRVMHTACLASEV